MAGDACRLPALPDRLRPDGCLAGVRGGRGDARRSARSVPHRGQAQAGADRSGHRLPVRQGRRDRRQDRVVDLHLLQHRGRRRRRAAAARNARAASGPSRADACRTGSSLAMRRVSVPRDGTGHPRLRQTRASSRRTAATDRFCLVRYRVRSRSRITASTSSGRCPRPRPPLDRRGIRSETTPSPSRQRRSSRYTCRRDTPSSAAAASAASHPTTSSRASGPITSARRTARLHTSLGTASEPPLSNHHRLVIHPRTSPSCTGAWDKPTLVQTNAGQPDVSYFLLCTHPQTRWPTVQRTSDIDRRRVAWLCRGNARFPTPTGLDRAGRRGVRWPVPKRTLGTPFGSFPGTARTEGPSTTWLHCRAEEYGRIPDPAKRQPPAGSTPNPPARDDVTALQAVPGRTRRSEACPFARESTGKRI